MKVVRPLTGRSPAPSKGRSMKYRTLGRTGYRGAATCPSTTSGRPDCDRGAGRRADTAAGDHRGPRPAGPARHRGAGQPAPGPSTTGSPRSPLVEIVFRRRAVADGVPGAVRIVRTAGTVRSCRPSPGRVPGVSTPGPSRRAAPAGAGRRSATPRHRFRASQPLGMAGDEAGHRHGVNPLAGPLNGHSRNASKGGGSMKYRTLGRTGIEVSPYCLGAMMFGAMGKLRPRRLDPDHPQGPGCRGSTSSTPPTCTPGANPRRSSARHSRAAATMSCSPARVHYR